LLCFDDITCQASYLIFRLFIFNCETKHSHQAMT